MEAFLKIAAVLVIVLACGLSLAACATVNKDQVAAAIGSPKVDQAAIGVEVVVATMANSFATIVSDPKADVDRAKLARQLADAGDVLAKARRAVDARSGGVSALVGEALGLVSNAIPAGTSLSARFALSTAFAGLQVYASTLDVGGVAAPPSDALIQARGRTDAALAGLRALLPAPSS